MMKVLETRKMIVQRVQAKLPWSVQHRLGVLLLVLLLGACGLALDNEARLDRGEEAFANADYRAAIVDAKDVLLDEPSNLRGRLLLGRASVEVGDGAAAEKELRRAIALGADAVELSVPLARAMFQQGKYEAIDDLDLDAVAAGDKVTVARIRADALLALSQPTAARELYESILSVEPDNVDAQLGVASSYALEGNASQARSTLDQIISNYPDNTKSWLASGSLNLRLRNFESAEENFKVALRLATEGQDSLSSSMALGALAESLFAQNKTDEAREVVNRLLQQAPDSLQARLLGARLSILDEDWQAAQQKLQAILRVVPEQPAALMMIGATHLHGGNLVQAEVYLSTLVAAVPENADARQLLAETRLQMKKNHAAEETLAPLLSGTGTESRFLAMAARASFGQGDYDEAIAYLRRSVENSPLDTGLRFQLATSLLTGNRPAEAEAVLAEINVEGSDENEYRRDVMSIMATIANGDVEQGLESAQLVVQKWPDNFGAYLLLGSIQISMQDVAAARANFERAADLSPGNSTSQRYLALADEAEDKLQSARARYLDVLEKEPQATWAMYSLARIDVKSENTESAIEWLEKLRATDATSVPPRALLAGLYVSIKDYRAAKAVALEGVGLTNDSAYLHTLLGAAQVGLTDYRDAAASYQRALQLDRDNVAYRLNLSKALRLSGDNASARRTLESGDNDPLDDLATAVALAGIMADESDLAGALDIARNLQRRHPDSPVPLALEAEVHALGENLELAADAYDRALLIDVNREYAARASAIKIELDRDDALQPLITYLDQRPLDSGIRSILAEAYQNNEQWDEAIGEYERVVEENAENAVALNNLAWIYYLENDSRAEATARRAQELLPDNAAIVDTLGWILLESGSLDESERLLRRAAQLSDGRPEIRYHMAVALSRTGAIDEAKRVLQDILGAEQPFPSRADAERLLASL